MLRLLATLLSLLAAPLGITLSSPSMDSPAGEPGSDGVDAYGSREDSVLPVSYPYVEPTPYEMVIDASAMPAEDGWFLVPLTAEQAVSVDVQAKHRQTYDPSRAQAAFVLVGDPLGNGIASGGLGYLWRPSEVNARGTRAWCCEDVTSRFQTVDSGTTESATDAWLQPGETLWVGLAAVGWVEGSKLKITLTSYGAPLYAGEPRTGTTVEAVDLVDEARRLGTNARLGGAHLVGDHGDVARSWSPAGTGFLMLDAYAQGDAGARIDVRLPSGAIHRNEDLHEESLGLMTFERGGRIDVRLADVHEPGPSWDGRSSGLQARAFYADLSVPLAGLQAWHSPIEYEDDDW